MQYPYKILNYEKQINMNKLTYIKTQFCICHAERSSACCMAFLVPFKASSSQPSLQWDSELFQQDNFLISGKCNENIKGVCSPLWQKALGQRKACYQEIFKYYMMLHFCSCPVFPLNYKTSTRKKENRKRYRGLIKTKQKK